jgi:hypothetical protein
MSEHPLDPSGSEGPVRNPESYVYISQDRLNHLEYIEKNLSAILETAVNIYIEKEQISKEHTSQSR